MLPKRSTPYVQLGCPALNYEHPTPFWAFITIIMKYNNHVLFDVGFIDMKEQSYKFFLWFDFGPR